MKCPVCGGSSLRRDCDRKIPYTYKGQETMLDVHGDWCPDCDEMIFSDEEAAAMEKQMADFKRLVNSQAVDPEFIQSVRKKLGLNQKQAGELFGGGAGRVAATAEPQAGAAGRCCPVHQKQTGRQ